MRKKVCIEGQNIVLDDIDPDILLKNIISMALSRAENLNRYSVNDFFALTAENDFLDENASLNQQFLPGAGKQKINLEEREIYILLRSRKRLFTRVNPYGGSHSSYF